MPEASLSMLEHFVHITGRYSSHGQYSIARDVEESYEVALL